MEKRGDIGPDTPDVNREMDKAAAAKDPELRDGLKLVCPGYDGKMVQLKPNPTPIQLSRYEGSGATVFKDCKAAVNKAGNYASNTDAEDKK